MPGFQIGDVFVLAGVPMIMTGMLEDIGHRLRGSQPIISRTVRVAGVGEGTIAAPLAAVARAHRDLSLGSYPFFDPAMGRYGSNLVVRGRESGEVDTAVVELVIALDEVGVIDISQPE